ncbi:MAG: signal peptidase II [Coraliomargaritaceae bacterium]
MRGNPLAYSRLLLTALALFVADQLSKLWVFINLTMNTDRIVILEDFFSIVHVGNEGAAWGMFSGHGGPLTLFALVALIAIYCFRHSLQLKHPPVQWLFGCICGGILGNTVDRMVHGHVIDFLDFRLPVDIPVLIPNGHYPAFNIADCGIVIGVIGYILYTFLYPLELDKGNTNH